MTRRNWFSWLLAAAVLLELVAPWLPHDPGRSSRVLAKAGSRRALQPGEIDVEKSRVYIRVGKKRLGHEHAVEGKIKSGSIDLKAMKDVGDIEFDMTSFVADTDEARKYVELKGTTAQSTREQVTETMLGESVLDVEQFPTATFKIKSREVIDAPGDERRLKLSGDFTLHGKKHPLTITVEQTKEVDRWRLRGDFTILQTDFGITPYKAVLGTVAVADKLKIWGDVRIAGDKADR